LAHQIRDHFLQVGSYTRLQVGVIVGGTASRHQVAALRRNPDLLVATPGRLLEHLERGSADLSDLEVMVVDEADRMLDMGFAADVLQIIGRCNPARQSLLCSATLDDAALRPITDAMLHGPELVVSDHHRALQPNLTHHILLADDPKHKLALLAALLDRSDAGKILVFTNTRLRAADLAADLIARGYRAAALHGQLDQPGRYRALDLLRRGAIRVLVATDVAARGLDVPGVDAVINFEVPRSGSAYLHRVGRTARAGTAGSAVSLVSAPEYNRMEGIARYLGLRPETMIIAGLEAGFRGPRRSRKPKKRTASVKGAKAPKSRAKVKDRHRDRKDIGKRRKQPPDTTPGPAEAGHGPLFKRS
jgi:superfamily II DNA/RNA helicase